MKGLEKLHSSNPFWADSVRDQVRMEHYYKGVSPEELQWYEMRHRQENNWSGL